ncbi:MAG: TlpA disulfide reductase family protein [Haliscomenobacter sp.]|uniref:TlpA disulfide reductase family protein n=1 Tax=Haliscomenobacter sp. TaxID=2717303 RepID=UPI0029B65A3C|nr:TlpA disulfide reductase family protein [Haliscomenobacter sp.]MDX2072379.1 TlpA disulfide reductase family protein [Haliscomenobacter sp.]
MKKIIHLTFLLAFCLNLTNTFTQNVRCKLEGKVIGRKSKTLLFLKATDETRFSGIKIPIIKNAFSFEFEAPFVEKYVLVFEDELENAMWRQIEFFAENGTINFVLHSLEDYAQNTISGGDLTQKMVRFNQQLINKRDSIRTLDANWKYEYIKQHPDVFSYSLLLELIERYSDDKKGIDIMALTELFPSFSKLYPSHPYTTKIAEMLNAIHHLKVGDHFLDFSAPTIDGEVKKVSELIKGKVAVIDMWASWCGPCRYLSKSMIPVYEKYKDKGFTIVGVAAEFKTNEHFKAAVKKDKYPWTNLIELDKQNGIWNKYNIDRGGGNTYLVDSNGVILAIHPKAEELEKILGDILK